MEDLTVKLREEKDWNLSVIFTDKMEMIANNGVLL